MVKKKLQQKKKIFRVNVRSTYNKSKIFDFYYILSRNKENAELFACDVFMDIDDENEYDYDDIYGQAKLVKLSTESLNKAIKKGEIRGKTLLKVK